MMIKTKLTQTEIAETLGVSQPTVSNWLSLKTIPQGLQKRALKEQFPELSQEIKKAWMKIDSKMSESQ